MPDGPHTIFKVEGHVVKEACVSEPDLRSRLRELWGEEIHHNQTVLLALRGRKGELRTKLILSLERVRGVATKLRRGPCLAGANSVILLVTLPRPAAEMLIIIKKAASVESDFWQHNFDAQEPVNGVDLVSREPLIIGTVKGSAGAVHKQLCGRLLEIGYASFRPVVLAIRHCGAGEGRGGKDGFGGVHDDDVER